MEILLGAIVSVLVQVIKIYFKTSSWKSWGAAIVLSLVAGAGYTALVHAGLWQSTLQILATSGAIYSFIFTRLEAVMNPQ